MTRWVWVIFGLLLIVAAAAGWTAADLSTPNAAQVNAASANTPLASAIALSFGRCDLLAESCQPHPIGEGASGTPEFRDIMLRCFGDTLGRPVYALDAAAETTRLWIDVRIPPEIQTPDAGQSLTMELMRGGHFIKTGLYVVELPVVKDYWMICQDLADRIRGMLG